MPEFEKAKIIEKRIERRLKKLELTGYSNTIKNDKKVNVKIDMEKDENLHSMLSAAFEKENKEKQIFEGKKAGIAKLNGNMVAEINAAEFAAENKTEAPMKLQDIMLREDNLDKENIWKNPPKERRAENKLKSQKDENAPQKKLRMKVKNANKIAKMQKKADRREEKYAKIEVEIAKAKKRKITDILQKAVSRKRKPKEYRKKSAA